MNELLEIIKNKNFCWIFISSLLLKISVLYLLPSTPSTFAPDEGTYAQLTGWIASAKDVEKFPSYGSSLYESSRSFILPAVLLHKLGLTELNSVRISSTIYGSLALLVFGMLVIHCQNSIVTRKAIKKSQWFTFIICIFAFLPSHFLWSVLGLKESTCEFWIISSVFFFSKLLKKHSLSLKTLLYLIGLFLTIVMSYGSRKQTTLVLITSLLVALLFVYSLNRRFFLNFSILFSILVGLLVGNLYTSNISSFSKHNEIQMNSAQTSSSIISENSIKTDSVSVKNQSSFLFFASNLLKSAQKNLEKSLNIDLAGISNGNALNAQSALKVNECNQLVIGINSKEDLLCNIKLFPYRLSSYMLRPFIFFDKPNSLSARLAMIENIIWLYLVVLNFQLILRIKKTKQTVEIFPVLFFAFLFICLSAYYEGNLGTAFRHKSAILWVLLYALLYRDYSTKKNSTDP